jgi:hypothetical protein
MPAFVVLTTLAGIGNKANAISCDRNLASVKLKPLVPRSALAVSTIMALPTAMAIGAAF